MEEERQKLIAIIKSINWDKVPIELLFWQIQWLEVKGVLVRR